MTENKQTGHKAKSCITIIAFFIFPDMLSYKKEKRVQVNESLKIKSKVKLHIIFLSLKLYKMSHCYRSSHAC